MILNQRGSQQRTSTKKCDAEPCGPRNIPTFVTIHKPYTEREAPQVQCQMIFWWQILLRLSAYHSPPTLRLNRKDRETKEPRHDIRVDLVCVHNKRKTSRHAMRYTDHQFEPQLVLWKVLKVKDSLWRHDAKETKEKIVSITWNGGGQGHVYDLHDWRDKPTEQTAYQILIFRCQRTLHEAWRKADDQSKKKKGATDETEVSTSKRTPASFPTYKKKTCEAKKMCIIGRGVEKKQ